MEQQHTEQHEPTRKQLTAIENEWPIIQAEIDVVDAECRLAGNPHDQIAAKALRKAQAKANTLRNGTRMSAGERRAA